MISELNKKMKLRHFGELADELLKKILSVYRFGFFV